MDLGGFRKQHKISLSTIWLGGMLEQHQNVTISQIWLGGMLENIKKIKIGLGGMLETTRNNMLTFQKMTPARDPKQFLSD